MAPGGIIPALDELEDGHAGLGLGLALATKWAARMTLAVNGVDFKIDHGDNVGMTELLEKAVLTARDLPPEMQDDIARMMLMVAGDDQPVVKLTSEQKASLIKSLDQAKRREFVTEEKVKAVWTKHGL